MSGARCDEFFPQGVGIKQDVEVRYMTSASLEKAGRAKDALEEIASELGPDSFGRNDEGLWRRPRSRTKLTVEEHSGRARAEDLRKAPSVKREFKRRPWRRCVVIWGSRAG